MDIKERQYLELITEFETENKKLKEENKKLKEENKKLIDILKNITAYTHVRVDQIVVAREVLKEISR